MGRDLIACRPADDFFVAQRLMRERHASRVVCVDDARRAMGVISLSDVARHEDRVETTTTSSVR
jgi:CBS domain-containing protein